MICLNPNCGKEAHVEEDAIICDHCGMAINVEGYAALYAMIASANQKQFAPAVGAMEMSYRDKVFKIVAAMINEGWMLDDTCKHLSGQEGIIRIAIEVVDAIDEALKEKEK